MIPLTHNAGVQLYGDRLAVLCLESQRILVLRLGADGTLADETVLGEFCSTADAAYFARTAPPEPPAWAPPPPPTQLADLLGAAPPAPAAAAAPPSGPASARLGGLKQRLLTFLARAAAATETRVHTVGGRACRARWPGAPMSVGVLLTLFRCLWWGDSRPPRRSCARCTATWRRTNGCACGGCSF